MFLSNNSKRILIIFFVALIFRILYIESLKDEILFHKPIVDSGQNEYYARQFADGKLDPGVFAYYSRVPVYPVFLSLIYRVFGRSLFISRFFQSLVGAFVCIFVYMLASRLYGQKEGLIAGMLSAFSLPMTAFVIKYLPCNLFIFFGLLSIVFLYKYLDNCKALWIFLSGLTLAFTCLIRANYAPVLAAICVWLFIMIFKMRDNFKKVTLSICLAAGVLIPILPSSVWHSHNRAELMPLHSNSGLVLYVGSNIEHIRQIRPGYMQSRISREHGALGFKTRRQIDSYWLNKTIRYIKGNTLEWLKGLLMKTYILFNNYEFSPRENINYFIDSSILKYMKIFGTGVMFSLAFLGALLTGKNKYAVALYAAFSAYYFGMFFIAPFSRYRLLIIPFLIIFASRAVAQISLNIYRRKWNLLFSYSAVIIPLMLLTCTNPLRGYLDSFSRLGYHRGLAFASIGCHGLAMREFRACILKDPGDSDIYEAMGDLHKCKRYYMRSFKAYTKALKVEKNNLSAKRKLKKIKEKIKQRS